MDPLAWLHVLQAVTQLLEVVGPPNIRGRT